MAPALVACPSCSQHVKLYETHCLHCGARLRSDGGGIRRTAGAMLMGLSLAGCPSDDSAETMGSGGSSTGDPNTTTTGDTSSSTSSDVTSSGEAEYGVPETGETFETTGGSDSTSVSATESDTEASSGSSSGSMETESSGGVEDTGSSDTGTPMTTGGTTDPTTGIEPLYGVMTTGVEPEYGVATTGGIEPDYGVPDPA